MPSKQIILIKIFSAVLFGVYCTCILFSCESYNQKNKCNTYEKMIIGNWKDSNSIIAYSGNKKFDGWFGDDKKRLQGYYEIAGDTLKMNFPSIKHYPEYIIEKMDTHFFEIKSLDDNEIFIKRKIEFFN